MDERRWHATNRIFQCYLQNRKKNLRFKNVFYSKFEETLVYVFNDNVVPIDVLSIFIIYRCWRFTIAITVTRDFGFTTASLHAIAFTITTPIELSNLLSVVNHDYLTPRVILRAELKRKTAIFGEPSHIEIGGHPNIIMATKLYENVIMITGIIIGETIRRPTNTFEGFKIFESNIMFLKRLGT